MIINTQAAIEVLQELSRRFMLPESGEEYICWELDAFMEDDATDREPWPKTWGVAHHEAAQSIKDYIGDQLGTADLVISHSLETTLQPFSVRQNLYRDRQVAQMARAAWLDRMVHELQTKGTLP